MVLGGEDTAALRAGGGARGTTLRAVGLIVLAAIIGVVGGVLGLGFQIGVDEVQRWLVGSGEIDPATGQPRTLATAVMNLEDWQVVAIPTCGGVVAGLVLLLLRRRDSPFGITDIIGLVALRKGTIRVRDSIVKILSSACTIGSGGSIGREGATAHIAATVGALLGRSRRVSSRTRAMLLGCGVAAGMATSYNAPIAGAIFVMEAVLGNFAMDVFAPIVVSSVLATIVRQALIGQAPIYAKDLEQQQLVLSWNLILAALLLGVLCGLGAILFRSALRHGKRLFKLTRLPTPLVLGLGGLIVGVIGLFRPQVWGNGFEVIEHLTRADATEPLSFLLALAVWKVVATVATVGSGGLGGIFTPNLVVGAAFGSFFAYAIGWLQPGHGGVQSVEQIAFAFVGMAGLCAATTHAPVTSVVLVFELTRHYELVLPIMLCSIMASIVARIIDPDNYYTEALKAKGQELPTGLEELAIKTTYVRDVMRDDVLTVRDTATFDDVMDVLANHRGDTIYVVDAGEQLVGRIQLQDVKNFINDPTLSSVVIAADLTRAAVTATADESIAAILPRFDGHELGELAVVGAAGGRQLRGRVRQQDVIAGIHSEVLGQQQRRARFGAAAGRRSGSIELPAGWEIATVRVSSVWQGLAIDSLPEDVQVWLVPLLVRRGGAAGGGAAGDPERLPATQELVLQEGDEITALVRSADWQVFQSPPPAPAA